MANTIRKKVHECEICGKALCIVDYGDGVGTYENDVYDYRGRWSCEEHIDELSAKVDNERENGIFI
jgi:hypothetical protein